MPPRPFRHRHLSTQARAAAIAVLVLVLLNAAAASEKEALSVPELIRDYETLEGKDVTVRGIFTGEAATGYMIPEMNAERYGESNIISIIMKPRFYRHFGRLERSLVEVSGKVSYNWTCDERVPYEDKVPGDEIVIVTFSCPFFFSGVSLDSISRLKILDSYAADDPRISGWFRESRNERAAVPVPETVSRYPALSKLAGAWRQAILDRDLSQLRLLSGGVRREKPLRPPERFYNIAFRGKESLRNQMRRNRVGPVHIVFRFWENPPGEYDVNVLDYHDAELCYCLQEICGQAELASLRRIAESSLRDPLWCFETEFDGDGAWYVDLDTLPGVIPDHLTEPGTKDP
jgi:hypothetical protein